MSEKRDKLILGNNEFDFNFKKNQSNLKISFNRVAFLFFIFIIIFVIYTSKLLFLISGDIKKEKNLITNSEFRSTILDRNNNILAKSVITRNIGINPKEVIDVKKLLINLKLIFPEKDFLEIEKKLNKKKFFYLEKKISQEKYEKIFLLGDKAIKEEQKISRIYPHGSLFSHILGQIDDQNNGVSGIEKYYDYELRSSEKSFILTVDSNIQHLIKEQLLNFKSVFNYVGSAAILMRVDNGEIISMISLPDYDLNKRANINDINYINRVSKALFEFGSVFKTFTYASGLEENVINANTKFIDLEKKIKCGKNFIGEYDKDIPSNLTAEEILIRSGNIGSVRIGQKVGVDNYSSFLKKLGLLDKINFDIEEVAQPLPIKWGKCKLATSSFGHGVTTTLLQLAKAYSIISNGGFEVNPTLIKKNNNNYVPNKRILKKDISKNVNNTLRKIVTKKEGTAEFANIEGYEIAGKTGTAQKSINGVYVNTKVNTFASIFPASSPKFVFIVLLDEPKANQEYVYNFRDGTNFKYKGNFRNTAGWTTVEVAGKIIEKIGPILATKY